MLGDEKADAIHMGVVALGEKPGSDAPLKGGGLSAAAKPPRVVRQARATTDSSAGTLKLQSIVATMSPSPQPSLPDLRQTAAL